MGTWVEFRFRVPGRLPHCFRILALQTTAFLPTAAAPHDVALISSKEHAEGESAHVPPFRAALTGLAFLPGVP